MTLVHCGNESGGSAPRGDGMTSSSSGDSVGTSSGSAPSSSSSSSSGSSNGSSSSSSGQVEPDGSAPSDYLGAGPADVTVTTGEAALPNGCELDYRRYLPAGAVRARIVLAHGFRRSVEDMDAVATRFASWGFEVFSAPLCNQSLTGVDHARNGTALVQLAASLTIEAPIYAGFSAGGLAAYLAASSSGRGYLGLDPVDASSLAADAAPLAGTSRFVLTAPSSCNSNGNFVSIVNADPNARGVRVKGAAHFDVERASCGGTDFGCQLCGATGAGRHETILRFATAALAELTGDAAAAGFFDPAGATYQAALADGTIEAP